MFGLFGKKKKDAPPPPDPLPPPPGWDAIEKAFTAIHGKPPRWWEHRGVHRMHDLRNPPENPLEAVALYDAGAFWHFVSFGMSDVYDKESEGDWSGFGYELTFRLPKDGNDDPSLWPVDVLISIARAAYKGEAFAPNHTLQTGPIDGRPETKLTALLMVKDPALPLLETPNGKVAFLLLVGVEGAVREKALATSVADVLEELCATNPDLVTRV